MKPVRLDCPKNSATLPLHARLPSPKSQNTPRLERGFDWANPSSFGCRMRAAFRMDPAASFIASLPSLMEVGGVPGVGIAVARRGKVVWHRSFGVKNIETRDPVTDNTLFEAASMTKPAFAYVVMKLVEPRGSSSSTALWSTIAAPITSERIRCWTGSRCATCFGTRRDYRTGPTVH